MGKAEDWVWKYRVGKYMVNTIHTEYIIISDYKVQMFN